MAQEYHSEEPPAYQYRPLTGDDIRVIRLQPGGYLDDLFAEITHIRFKPAPVDQDIISTKVVDSTLPGGWKSYQTPEGRLFYDPPSETLCQYEHPSLESVPEELRDAVNAASAIAAPICDAHDDDLFEALSYAWGDPKLNETLYIQDPETADSFRRIPITSSLSSALRHLRHPHEPRSLWVDAVCINQNNEAEKSRQVHRIPDVFRSAWRVIAWLVEASFDSGLAMKTMRYLGEQIEISQQHWIHLPPDAEEQQWFNPHFKLPYCTSEWEALASLMERPWFKRLWVLQEIALANSNAMVQCGPDTISYYFFRRAVPSLTRRSGSPESLQGRIDEKVMFTYGPKSIGMWNLIRIAREHSCSVLHDKIYGLLGFIGPKLRNTIQPSYQKPLPQVFKELFLAHSKSTNCLELLAHCLPVGDLDIPSWVPDWGSYGDSPSFIADVQDLAAGMSKADFCEIQPGELQVSGVLHDSITSTFEILNSTKGDQIGAWLRKLRTRSVESATYPTGEDIHQALTKVLCRGQLRERFPEISQYTTLEEWQQTLDMLITRQSSKRADYSDLSRFARSQQNTWELVRFFRTEHGYLGCGPVDMVQGDQVCILLGLYCPLVIRPCGNGHFTVVGSCYLQGLMDSEALLGQLPKDFKVQNHVLGVRDLTQYYNIKTEEVTAEDPRLGPLDKDWHRVDQEVTDDEPTQVDFFQNNNTGQIINYDPRLTVAALEQRGVKLQTITLV